ncbi:MAG: glycosyl hydrolase family 18 protein [Sphingomonadaceae bacterium]
MLRPALFSFIALLAALILSSAFPEQTVRASLSGPMPVRWAYYVPEDPTSLDSLRQRTGDLDYVGLHWASVRDDGSVDLKAKPDVISIVRSIGARPLLSVALSRGADTARAILATEDTRSAAVAALATVVADYDGISIDFEGLYPEDRDSLTRFMAQLSARLRPAGKLVTMALSAKTSDTRTGWAGAIDYAGLAPHSDIFVVMTYGFRTARSSVPGSTAPFSWVAASIAFAASQIPAEKLLLGIPLYGYDWDTTSGPPARALRYPETLALAQQYGATIRLDPTQQSSTFTYSQDGHTHEVWFEDRASLAPKLALVAQHRLAGVAAWRLGHEDPQVWQAINALRPTPPPAPAPNPTPAPQPTPTAAPSGGSGSWYFAEGSTAAPFDTWILLQNPNPVPATARLTFMPEGRPPVVHEMLIGPTSRTSVFANQMVPNAAFSTRIDSSQPLLAERAMYAGFDGHVVTAVTAPSRTWYLAEGATTEPFHTWILLQNPNPVPAYVRVNYLLESGAPMLREMLLSPNSRTSIFANDVIPNAAFSTRIESDQPIIAERAMYRFPGNAATGVTGVASPSRNWFFAAGLPTLRNVPVDSWLLLQNPSPNPVTATVTLYSTDGQTATHQQYLPPTSRQSIYLNQIFQARSFGIKVEATGEIIAERSVFIAPSAFSGNQPQGAYATQGATQLGTVWALAEGSTAQPFSTKISVLNPNGSPMQARFQLMLEDGQVVTHDATVEANRSLDLEMDGVVRSASFSARVTTSLPSVVERTMLWAKDGKTGVHNTIGVMIE